MKRRLWYLKAAEQGLPEAQFLLAPCYQKEDGVEAVEFYR
jgi:TPR repeat protein